MRRYGQHLEVDADGAGDHFGRCGPDRRDRINRERISTELCLTSWRLSLALLKS
jgi:hypothetical protein